MFPRFTPQPRPAELRWKYVQVRHNQPVKGWVAGPTICVPVHWGGASKPCRRKLTEGRLGCPWCEAQAKQRLIGYMPLLDRSAMQLVVCLSETVALEALRLALGTDLEVRRSAGSRDPVQLKVLVGYEAARPLSIFTNSSFRQRGGYDIQPWLLHLWGDPELASFFEHQQGGSSKQNGASPTLPTVAESTPVSIPSPPPRSSSNGQPPQAGTRPDDHPPGEDAAPEADRKRRNETFAAKHRRR